MATPTAWLATCVHCLIVERDCIACQNCQFTLQDANRTVAEGNVKWLLCNMIAAYCVEHGSLHNRPRQCPNLMVEKIDFSKR